MMKKTIALLLAFLIILSSAPAFTAYAQESPEQPVTLEAEGEPAADEEPNEEQESDEQFFPGEMNLFKGESAAITGFENVSGSFGSSNRVVATVSADGTVVAVSPGSTDVVFTDSDGNRFVCKVTVTDKVDSVSFSKKSLTLTVNRTESLKLTASPAGSKASGVYSSSNASVASVDANGKVTALKKGTADIKFVSSEGLTAECKVTVNNTTLPLTLTAGSATLIYDAALKKGTTYQIDYKKNSKAFYKVKYSSSDKNVATVSSSGVVSPCGAGKAKIYVNADGAAATFYVTVVATSDKNLTLNETANRAALSCSSTTRYVYGTTVQGRELEAYIIKGSNSRSDKIIFADFACHGFEDGYFRDGKVLVEIGNQLVDYYANKPWYLNDYTLVVVPCANPDGTIAGKNNSRENSTAFGRCTAAHVDINRDFIAFNGKESIALRNLFARYNPDVYLNFHGWLNTSIGTDWLAKLSSKELSLSRVQKNEYVSGYIMTYVYRTFGAASCLVEYKSPDSAEKSVNKTVNFIYKTAYSGYRAKTVKNGWVSIGSRWKHYANGSMATGWKYINKKWYYFNSYGTMQTGWRKINKKWYYFYGTGSMATGWVKHKGKWYYLKNNGAMATGWIKHKGKWYYTDKNGAMLTGIADVSGKQYYFESSGAMATGFKTVNNKKYYFASPDGDMKKGWQTLNGKEYYFANDGVMVNKTVKLDGYVYVFDVNGVKIDRLSESGTRVSFSADGNSGENKITLSWNKPDEDVSGYQVVWSETESFENVLTLNCPSADILSADIFVSGENKGYVRIRAYKNYPGRTIYFDWCSEG